MSACPLPVRCPVVTAAAQVDMRETELSLTVGPVWGLLWVAWDRER